MATLKQVRDKADAKLVQFWQTLSQKQDAYFSKNGEFFQLLVSGGKDVENKEYPFTVRAASDEKYILDIDATWADSVPFEIEVHNWDGSNGKGYKAIISVEYRGKIYQRWRDSNNTDSGWYEYIEPII